MKIKIIEKGDEIFPNIIEIGGKWLLLDKIMNTEDSAIYLFNSMHKDSNGLKGPIKLDIHVKIITREELLNNIVGPNL